MDSRIKDISPLAYKSGKLHKIALLVISICLIAACSKVAEPPQTREIEHYDEYHGIKVLDSYRWLEDFTSDEVKAWVSKQNFFTESFLSNDFRDEIQKDLESIWTSEYLSTPFVIKIKLFFILIMVIGNKTSLWLKTVIHAKKECSSIQIYFQMMARLRCQLLV